MVFLANDMEYRIIRSKNRKRTIKLEVNGEGEIIVFAPDVFPVHRIDRLVGQHKLWLEQRLKKYQTVPKKQFGPGEYFLYLGEEYPLSYVDDTRKRPKVHFSPPQGFVVLGDSKTFTRKEIQKVLQRWYKQKARDYLQNEVDRCVLALGVRYNQLRIKDAKTRWGSCSSKGNINLNWRLIMAPKSVIRYVVIHEVCHLIEPNHSRAFWEAVARQDPDFKQHKLWLRKNGPSLRSV